MIFRDHYGGQEGSILPNTPVGMTSVFIHQDESIFPDACSFVPEHWIDHSQLDRYLVSFSKGSRQCLGINLAYAEMKMCLASIFLQFGSGGKEGVRMQGDEEVLERTDDLLHFSQMTFQTTPILIDFELQIYLTSRCFKLNPIVPCRRTPVFNTFVTTQNKSNSEIQELIL